MKPLLCVTGLAMLSLPTLLFAQEVDEPTEPPSSQLEAGVGFGQIWDDDIVAFRLAFLHRSTTPTVDCRSVDPAACEATFDAHLELPLRLVVGDSPPTQDGVIRAQDWDQPADYFRVVRRLEWGSPRDALHLQIGELGAQSIGHGTIVSRYLNVVTVDAFQPGVIASANTMFGGAEVLLDNAIAPELFALRGFVRPALSNVDSWWHRLALGVTAATDLSAPTELATAPDGSIAVALGASPKVVQDDTTTWAGIDAELNLVEAETFGLVPYLDLNLGSGFGGHLGADLVWRPAQDVRVGLRLEGRLLGPGYIPDYFDALYEVDRFQYFAWGTPVAAPKLEVARARTGTLVGGRGQLDFSWRGVGSLSAAVAEHAGADDSSIWLRAAVAPPGPVQFAALYARRGVEPEDLLTLDGSVLMTEARVAIWGPLHASAQLGKLWVLHETGEYATVLQWQAGLGAAYGF